MSSRRIAETCGLINESDEMIIVVCNILVNFKQARHNTLVTGQDPVRIITHQMFVEQESNGQADNRKQRKLPLFYNNFIINNPL